MNTPRMYDLLIAKNAEKGIKKLPNEIVTRIIAKIQQLKTNPKPVGCRKITGSESDYRIRIGSYRVIYEINDKEEEIIIMAVGHRKNVYKYL